MKTQQLKSLVVKVKTDDGCWWPTVIFGSYTPEELEDIRTSRGSTFHSGQLTLVGIVDRRIDGQMLVVSIDPASRDAA